MFICREYFFIATLFKQLNVQQTQENYCRIFKVVISNSWFSGILFLNMKQIFVFFVAFIEISRCLYSYIKIWGHYLYSAAIISHGIAELKFQNSKSWTLLVLFSHSSHDSAYTATQKCRRLMEELKEWWLLSCLPHFQLFKLKCVWWQKLYIQIVAST